MLIENIRGALSGEKGLFSTGHRRTIQYNELFEKMRASMIKSGVKGITDKTDMFLDFDGMIDENGNCVAISIWMALKNSFKDLFNTISIILKINS